jgi:hypothetical protein
MSDVEAFQTHETFRQMSVVKAFQIHDAAFQQINDVEAFQIHEIAFH